jgi:hypothetical protein
VSTAWAVPFGFMGGDRRSPGIVILSRWQSSLGRGLLQTSSPSGAISAMRWATRAHARNAFVVIPCRSLGTQRVGVAGHLLPVAHPNTVGVLNIRVPAAGGNLVPVGHRYEQTILTLRLEREAD